MHSRSEPSRSEFLTQALVKATDIADQEQELLRLALSLPIHFIKKDRSRAADVQGIDFARHRNSNRLIAGGESRRRETVAFAPEYQAAILFQVALRRRFAAHMRMGSDAMNAARPQVL